MNTGLEHFGAVLSRHHADRPSAIAVHDGPLRWTFADTARVTHQVIGELESAGVRCGHTVALMVPNSAAFVAAFFAIASVGCVVAPFNVRYKRQELHYYIKDTDAAAIIASPDLCGEVLGSMEDSGRKPAVVSIDAEGAAKTIQPGREPAGSPAGGEPTSDDSLLLQYTSGSTGAPKRIFRTHGQLLLELEQLQTIFQVATSDRFLGVAPFSHVNGLVRTMMTSMFVGGTLHTLPAFDRRRVLELITNERITYFGGVPYMFTLLADSPLRGAVDLTSLRVVFSASAPLLEGDNRRFLSKYGKSVRQLYGSTETGMISVNLGDDPMDKPESVGTAVPGVRIQIIGEDGAPLPAGIEGEVAIASPWAIMAYEGNPSATAEAFIDGAYRSGDLGIIDADGYLTLTGRKKFMINRGGFKVNPLEVEKAILSFPKVREVVVVGQASRFGDDIVRAVVVATENCEPEEIVEHCRARIADYKVPSQIEFRDELPKSQTGKILRHEL